MKQYRTLIIILVIAAIAIYLDLPNNFGLFGRQIFTHLGLDLVGGVQALLEADLPASTPIDSTAMDTARSIVENRVNGLGVSEAVVQRAGDRRIVVEIPGAVNPDEALATIKTTGLLEFVDFSNVSPTEAQSLVGQTIKTDYAETASSGAPASTVTPAATPAVQATPTVSATKTVSGTVATPPPAENATVYHTVMTGASLKNVGVQASTVGGTYEVAFTLNEAGTKTFADFTASHVGKILAIVLDKKVINIPSINNAITQGSGVITGGFTSQSANALAIQLRYGSLPIPLKIVNSTVVGPTLGQDSLRRSLVAGAIGLGLVIIFMILYYRLPGIVADAALVVYALITYALFRSLPVTLTLPGIAGFVLSIGMAVDANILIFERLKEELRSGKTLRSAIDLGWSRAWPSIRDSNISTLITCLILYFFGSAFGASIVKGFAFTLGIGVGVSLFTAIIVSRTFLHLVLDNLKFAEHTKWFGI